MLEINAAERRALLKMAGLKPTKDDGKTAVELLAGLKDESDVEGAVAPAAKKRKKKHWTQRPENRKKVLVMSRKGMRTRKSATASSNA